MKTAKHTNSTGGDELSKALLEVSGTQYPIAELNQFGFHVESSEEDWQGNSIRDGELKVNGAYQLPVRFRARRRTSNGYRCSLHDLSLADQATLDEMVQEMARESGDRDELQSLSYDQIAQGAGTEEAQQEGATPFVLVSEREVVADAANIDSSDETEPRQPAKKKEKAGSSKAGFAALLMAVAMIVGIGLVAMLVKGRSVVELHHCALAGNFQPLTTDYDAQVAELFVSEGDMVTKGQPLFRLVSAVRDEERDSVKLELDTALAELGAIEKQVSDYDARMELAAKALQSELAIARAELAQAAVDQRAAAKLVTRLRPLKVSGAISAIEYEDAMAQRDSMAEAQKIKQAQIDALRVKSEGFENGVLVGEGGAIDDRLPELEARVSVAQAKVVEARKRLEQIESLADPAAITAPSDGTVYSVYRGLGDFVKMGQQILSISGSGRSWALGHIHAEDSTKVRPGQKVMINVPSVGVRAEGRVVAVGHRGIHAQGDWSADFRAGAPTDVPIKVQLPELPVELPSGIRLDMSVSLDRVWPWQKRKTIEVAWPGDQKVEGIEDLSGTETVATIPAGKEEEAN